MVMNKQRNLNKDEIRERIIKALKNVYDPEIPINIYDLGLIYKIEISNDLEIRVEFTLTVPTCPMIVPIQDWIFQAVREAVPEAKKIEVVPVFDPPWTPKMMTKEGRELFKAIFGFDIVEEWEKKYGNM